MKSGAYGAGLALGLGWAGLGWAGLGGGDNNHINAGKYFLTRYEDTKYFYKQ